MRTEQSLPVRLADYRPPDWLVETVALDVSLHPTASRVRATLQLKPNPKAAAPAAAGAGRRRAHARGADARRRAAGAGTLCRHARPPHHRAAAAAAVPARDRDRGRPLGQHPAHGPLPLRPHLLHPMRGGRFSAHHLFPRSARRDGGLHHAHRGRQRRSAGAARQRQSRRIPASLRAAGISRSGTIRSRNRRICSRWWRERSALSRTRSAPCRVAT